MRMPKTSCSLLIGSAITVICSGSMIYHCKACFFSMQTVDHILQRHDRDLMLVRDLEAFRTFLS